MTKSVRLFCVAAVGMFGAVSPVRAANNFLFGYSPYGVQTLVLNGTTVVQAADTGWLDNTGSHSSDNSNYIVGDSEQSYGQTGATNDYFNFDLGGVHTPVISAVLSVGNGHPYPGGSAYEYDSYTAGPLSTFSLFDVNSPISSLDFSRSEGDVGGMALFIDLQSGTLYGSRDITNVVQYGQVDTTLNSVAIAAINSALGGSFAIGGTLRPGTTIPVFPVVPVPGVPEPATWAMFIYGFAIIGSALRRRTKALLSV